MNVSPIFVTFIFLNLFIVILSKNSNDYFVSREDIICVQRSRCSCVFPNGTGIDLLPSAKKSVLTSFNTYEETLYPSSGVVLSTYYYHPCYDVTFAGSIIEPTSHNMCKQRFTICRRVIFNTRSPDAPNTLVKDNVCYDFLASSDNTEFAPDGSYIKYLNMLSYTIVYLVCADIADALYAKDLSEPTAIKLQFLSRNACMRQICKKSKHPASNCKTKFRKLNSSEILIATLP
ncbi:uncharacterized protein [Choristoneura fumiferana]|uniref:uncharacterized protein n=1 Tax=Choristoneura fumiferana TaxID=7141 RepID=UPI003D15B156